MNNYEKLAKTNLYDLLCAIQTTANSGNFTGLCVIENITGKGRECPTEDSFGEGCKQCISDWLREEFDA